MFDDSDSRVILAENLTLAYRDEPVVDDFSLSVPRGTVLGIVGESGSGKSTIAAAIAGFLPHFGGRIVAGELRVLGESRRRAATRHDADVIPPSTRGVTMIFQDAMTSMDPVSSIGAQLTAAMHGARRMKRAHRRAHSLELLRKVGFTDPERQLKARSGDLSGGMRQRALIAVALAAEPEVLIADEPTSALDVRLANLTMRLLVDSARERATTLVIVAHDLELVAVHADVIAVMRRGRLVEHGPARSVLTAPRELYTQQLLACVPSLESYRLERLATVAPAGAVL